MKAIAYLRTERKWCVVIKDFVGFLGKEPSIASSVGLCISHECPWCMKLKAKEELWNRCQRGNSLLRNACAHKRSWFIGSAWCGIPEFISPVFCKDQVVGALCIGGFPYDMERNERRARQAAGKNAELLPLWRETFTLQQADLPAMIAASGAICDWLTLYYTQLWEFGMVRPGEVYKADASRLITLTHARAFIRNNWRDDIHAPDIARFCHCSVSYLSHLFKKTLNRSIGQAINDERITHAKRLLADSEMRITEIAMACGFGDSNYFSFVFRRETGTTPSEFRQSIHSGRKIQ